MFLRLAEKRKQDKRAKDEAQEAPKQVSISTEGEKENLETHDAQIAQDTAQQAQFWDPTLMAQMMSGNPMGMQVNAESN